MQEFDNTVNNQQFEPSQMEKEANFGENINQEPQSTEIPQPSFPNEPQLNKVEDVLAQHIKKPTPTVTTDNSITPDKTFDKHNNDFVTVQPVKFASFENDELVIGTPRKNLDIMQDVNIKITVELGRAKMKVKKILDMNKGTIIEINKVAGEQVELYVCGKLVAFGEVIVIEDKFGLRITSIAETRN